MISINQLDDLSSAISEKMRRIATSKAPAGLTEIYQEEINLVIWQRELNVTVKKAVSDFLASNRTFQIAQSITPQSALSVVRQSLGNESQPALGENIAELVDMFCCLFDLKRAGLRLTVLDRAMCPKFHVDKVPCRLVSTYQGMSTEWLPHHAVDRTKLGIGSNGYSDEQSGLFQSKDDIHQLNTGDVALLKGELWEGNENAGLVHRSPALKKGESRLLLTLDFSD
ncbi:DUF1826 domain-containing protein [Spartinivicinus poritis]|uniref:DUF1826 domain-containing protein n=1 Tax=Spartinivicinus poritis TaxID=2994640 RepID=A0ABT5ULF8_9GAMM|nr:DUF1826 domain-containing protein [Spartinivicinus sp. A2-2]MDE1465869.1 DUF1826 domain-containing protein [Spartinivicinus sp. A2-2]